MNIDPLAESFFSDTPYNYTLNNPISNIDPDGRFTFSLSGQAAQDFARNLQRELDQEENKKMMYGDNDEPTPKEAALIAKHVYGDKKDPGYLIGGWKVSSIGKDINLINERTGFKSGVYERTINGVTEYVYATAGTDDWQDIKHDVLQPLGMSSQYGESLENVKNLKNIIGSAELTFTGHSLGGGLAENNSLYTGDKAITFNAAGVSLLTSRTGKKSNTDAYIMTTDPLNALQQASSIPTAGGKKY